MTNNNQISIIRVGQKEYLDFCHLLEWRRTGQEKNDISAYKEERIGEFFKKHNILDSDMFYIFAAKIEEKFVGYITATLIPKPDPRLGTLYVDELWVAEAYRRKNIAKMLMDEVFKLSKEMNMWKVRLYVEEDNIVARNFYKKVGFSEINTAIFCEKSNEEIIV
jgi:ribosomal protein S18 acetylase RimI-like enzyme